MVDERKLWSYKIDYIKKLKEFFSEIEYQGINLWPVMAPEVYTYYYFANYDKIEEPTPLKRFLMSMKYLFFSGIAPVQNAKNKLFVSYPLNRKDHYELISRSVSGFNGKDVTIYAPNYERKSKFIEELYKIRFPNVVLLCKLFKKFNKTELSFIPRSYRLLYFAKTYLECKQVDRFAKSLSSNRPKAHIAFCSSGFSEEAVITSICKKDKIPTFTLQHGFIPDHSGSFKSIDVQNENVIADYSLLWGKSSFDIQKTFVDANKLIIAGNPKYDIKIQKSIKNFRPKIATLFLSVPSFKDSNKKMISIVNEFSNNHPEIKIRLKAHPFDKESDYTSLITSKNLSFEGKEKSVGDLLKDSDFVILHSTSISYEALIYRIPIFKFKDKNYSKFWDDRDAFSNAIELDKLFKDMQLKEKYVSLMNFYDSLLKNTFYFENEKKISRIYREKIENAIKDYQKKSKV